MRSSLHNRVCFLLKRETRGGGERQEAAITGPTMGRSQGGLHQLKLLQGAGGGRGCRGPGRPPGSGQVGSGAHCLLMHSFIHTDRHAFIHSVNIVLGTVL